MTDEKKDPNAGGKGDFSSLWQSALGQIDEIRDVIVRGSQAGKAKIDAQLLKRQRDKLLQNLGERMFDEHRRLGARLPDGAADLVAEIEALDEQIAESDREAERLFKKP